MYLLPLHLNLFKTIIKYFGILLILVCLLTLYNLPSVSFLYSLSRVSGCIKLLKHSYKFLPFIGKFKILKCSKFCDIILLVSISIICVTN